MDIPFSLFAEELSYQQQLVALSEHLQRDRSAQIIPELASLYEDENLCQLWLVTKRRYWA